MMMMMMMMMQLLQIVTLFIISYGSENITGNQNIYFSICEISLRLRYLRFKNLN